MESGLPLTTELEHYTPCMIHGVSEPDLPGDYKTCAECWHVYRSPWALLVELNKLFGWSEPLATDVSRVLACPLCCHDF